MERQLRAVSFAWAALQLLIDPEATRQLPLHTHRTSLQSEVKMDPLPWDGHKQWVDISSQNISEAARHSSYPEILSSTKHNIRAVSA